MTGLVFIGFAVGLYIGSVVSARYGRRMVMFSMSLWALCTAAIVVSAKTKEQMIIGRILNYSYVVCHFSDLLTVH
jgi:MFS family permease